MSAAVGALRWWIIGLVTLETIANYLARPSLSVAAPTFKAELSLTTQQYSWSWRRSRPSIPSCSRWGAMSST